MGPPRMLRRLALTSQRSARRAPGLLREVPDLPTGYRRAVRQGAGTGAILAAALTFVGLLAAWLRGGGGFDLPWVPSLDLRLAFRLDGLGALCALLAAGVGVAVF